MYRIIDLDNCISSDAWRRKYINKQMTGQRRYHDYHSLAAFDDLANSDLLCTKEQLLILTGRPVLFRAITEEWLRRNCIRYRLLMMRNNDDHRSSPELKGQQLEWLFGLEEISIEQITSAFDDRQDIVNIYRSIGIHNAEVRAIRPYEEL